MVRIFSYGTLITGALEPRVRDFLARHVIDRREGTIPGRLYDLGPYPGLVPSPRPGERVAGQVLTLRNEAEALRLFDAYEGCAPRHPERGLYRRERARVALYDGGHCLAWVYWYNATFGRADRVPHGDWRRHVGANGAHATMPDGTDSA